MFLTHNLAGVNSVYMEISASAVFEKIEQQKLAALRSTIHVVANDTAYGAISGVLDSFKRAYHNDSLFQVHSPDETEQALAQAVPRTIVFFFYRSDSFYQKQWFDKRVAPQLAQIPVVDVLRLDMARVPVADGERLKALGVKRTPCVLVYKMGHQIDTIFPENEGTLIGDQVAQYRSQVMQKIEPPRHVDYSKEGLKNDDDRIAFENRLRDKEAEERRKQAEAERMHRIAVKRKIEEDKAQRMRK